MPVTRCSPSQRGMTLRALHGALDSLPVSGGDSDKLVENAETIFIFW